MMNYPKLSTLPEDSYAARTVMFVDMAESAKLKWEAEWREAYKTTRRHNDKVKQEANRHEGLVISEIGDGILAVFDRPEQAVNAAISTMKMLQRMGIGSKVAIHTGSVCLLKLQDNRYDVFGSAVDIAARILSLCRSGEILLSTVTLYELSGKKELDINLIGRGIMLRHIGSPVDIYSVVWDPRVSPRAGIFLTPADQLLENVFPKSTTKDATDNLKELFKKAEKEVTIFGLTRNFYAEHMLEAIEEKANRVPVKIFLMDPDCTARKERYRLEPIEAAMEDPTRFRAKVVEPLRRAKERIDQVAPPDAGLTVKFFNFYPSFAIEFLDDYCRVMLYGHMKRGTDSPILIFKSGNEYYQYFRDQVDWIMSKAEDREYMRDIREL